MGSALKTALRLGSRPYSWLVAMSRLMSAWRMYMKVKMSAKVMRAPVGAGCGPCGSPQIGWQAE